MGQEKRRERCDSFKLSAPETYEKEGAACNISYFQCIGKKDEDRVLVHAQPLLQGCFDAMYCIFDGHNGPHAADLCVAELTLLVEKTYEEDYKGQDIEDILQEFFISVFAKLDEKVRSQHVAGTTATVLLQRCLEDGSTDIHCINVGDSWCTAKVGDEPVEMLTSDHSTRNGSELSRTFEALKKQNQDRVEEQSESIGRRTTSVDSEMNVQDTPKKKPQDSSSKPESRSNLLVEVHNEDGTVESTHQFGEVIRSTSFVGKLIDPRTGQKSLHRIFSTGGVMSLQVTRSIGDDGSAHTVVPHPDFRKIKIPVGTRCRLIAASDGCWDVFDGEKAHKSCSILTTTNAAKSVAMAAKEKRLYGGKGVDDISVLVIDINADSAKPKAKRISDTKGRLKSTAPPRKNSLFACLNPSAAV